MNTEELRDKICDKAFNAIYDVIKEAMEKEIRAKEVVDISSCEKVREKFMHNLRGCCDDLVSNVIWEAVSEIWAESTLH